MWTYMMVCYALSLLSFFLLAVGFLQHLLGFSVFQAGHLTFMILICIVYLFTETLVIFFFVGTGMGIKEAVQKDGRDPGFHRRSITVKRQVFPPLLLNMLLMMSLFILAGAADTRRLPVRAYTAVYAGCLFHFVRTKIAQNRAFRNTTEIFIDLYGKAES